MRKLVSLVLNLFPLPVAYAHCDIPCGIYDPHAAQVGAHTVIRMTQLLAELKREDETKAEHDIARMTHVKEEHGTMIEEELGTLENDYFKEEHFKEYSELTDLIYETVKLSGTVRQNLDLVAADKLLANTQKIAEIFWKTKGLEPIIISSGYPTEGEIVSHK